MKYLFLFALSIVATCGSSSVCNARVPNNYIAIGTCYGSFQQLKGSTYNEIFGYYVEAEYYDGKLFLINTTFTLFEGKSGKLIGTGWYWLLVQDGTSYSMVSLNGSVSPCTNSTGYQLEKYSQLIANLNVLYPIPGQRVDPDVLNMCSGVNSRNKSQKDELMTLGWIPGDKYDQMVFVSSASNGTIIRKNIREMRELKYSQDKDIFKNRCNHPETVSRSIPFEPSERVEEILRKLYN